MKSKRFNQRVIKSFDHWAPTYENIVISKLKQRGYGYDELAHLFISTLKPSPNTVFLELGTGPGVLGKEIAKLTNAQLVGLDISQKMLRQAAASSAYTLLYQCSAEDIPLPDASIDGLYSTFMLHSIMNQDKVVSEIKRILKANASGILVDLCPNPSKLPFWNLIRGNFHSFQYEHGAPSKYKTAEQYADMFLHAGFEVIQTKRLGKKKDYTHYLIEFKKGES